MSDFYYRITLISVLPITRGTLLHIGSRAICIRLICGVRIVPFCIASVIEIAYLRRLRVLTAPG